MLKRSILVLFFCTSFNIIGKGDPELKRNQQNPTEESDSSDSELSPIFHISDDDSSSEDESSDEESNNEEVRNNDSDNESSDDGYFFVPLNSSPQPHEETEAVLPGNPLIMPENSTLYENDTTLEQPVPAYQQLLRSLILQTMNQVLSLASQSAQFENESNTLQAQPNTFSRITPVPRAQNPRRNRPANLTARRSSVQDPRRLNPINRRRPTTRWTQTQTNQTPQTPINPLTQMNASQEDPHTPENQIVRREDIPTPGAPIARRRLNFSQRRRGARRSRPGNPHNNSFNNQRMDQ